MTIAVAHQPETQPNVKALTKTQDGTGVIDLDPWLEPYKGGYALYKHWKDIIDKAGGYEQFSRGYEKLGFRVGKDGITYREWAPNAKEAFLFGEF
ncbi:alpha-1,4-glucan branching enzyme, partial [Lunasporangiospora selenospora]